MDLIGSGLKDVLPMTSLAKKLVMMIIFVSRLPGLSIVGLIFWSVKVFSFDRRSRNKIYYNR